MKEELLTTSLVALLLVSCVTVEIPPEKAAWSECLREQIALANETNYVYVPVMDKQEMKIVEQLAFHQGKETQRIERDGETLECIFVFGRERYLRSDFILK